MKCLKNFQSCNPVRNGHFHLGFRISRQVICSVKSSYLGRFVFVFAKIKSCFHYDSFIQRAFSKHPTSRSNVMMGTLSFPTKVRYEVLKSYSNYGEQNVLTINDRSNSEASSGCFSGGTPATQRLSRAPVGRSEEGAAVPRWKKLKENQSFRLGIHFSKIWTFSGPKTPFYLRKISKY